MTTFHPATATLLEATRASALIETSKVAYFENALHELAADVVAPASRDERRANVASVVERLAFEAHGLERRDLGEAAFLCRRTAFGIETDFERVLHYLFLSVDGLMAERHAELVMLLRQEDLSALLSDPHSASWEDESASWEDELVHRVAAAFVLLCRKDRGWGDVSAASDHVHRLRTLQAQREQPYLGAATTTEPTIARLVTLYNLAKTVEITASFLIEGSPNDPLVQLERFAGQAERVLALSPDPFLTALADALRVGAELLVRSSVWFNTRQLGARFRDFVREIAGAHREAPVLELWPSQREALTQNLLNPAKRAIVVEMPTSAGKTLIAEFGIVQALALDPEAAVAYVVPTRALVNQVTARLRKDFGPLGYQVEAAVPVFELDPTEDLLLRQGVNVVVLTPEKLDLLLRVNHPAVEQLSLVVADEAHNIAHGERGARLELLLGIIRRERPAARFLLLTPFVPNGEDLAAWLGEDPDGRIQVTWRPSERLVAAAQWKKRRNGPVELKLRTLASATNVDLHDEIEFQVGEVPAGLTKSKKGIAASAAVALAKRGGVLILERGRSFAEDRAVDVAKLLPAPAESDPFAATVAHFAATELGEGHPLPGLLVKGVAFHHAGLSHDLRLLVELLIERGAVKVVAGTTTLAQGVNFPIASVIVESLQKYVGPPKQWEQLSYSEFWNIAGRAGRAMRDRLGLVVFPSTGPSDLKDIRQFLQDEAENISSALMSAIADLGEIAETFNLNFVANHPAIAVFLQYLTHALRVAGHEAATAEIEDILRSSFVYSQARQQDRAVAERLVALSRRYLDDVRGKSPGYLALADGTGFSVPTVDMLFAVQRQHDEFGAAAFWDPDRLFAGDLEGLTSVVSVLADIPELSLGRSEGGPLNAGRVAGILSDWVHGAAVDSIADGWFAHVDDPVDRVREASLYLYSTLVGQVPWGIGAVQRLSLDEDAAADVGHVPSLIFYGVHSKEAVQLRMAGVPRVAAEGLAESWRSSGATAQTFADLREWISSRDDAAWTSALPSNSPLSGPECRQLWGALAGIPSPA